MYLYIQIHTYISIHIYVCRQRKRVRDVYRCVICIYLCMYVCAYIYMRVYVYMDCIYTCSLHIYVTMSLLCMSKVARTNESCRTNEQFPSHA